MRPVIQWNEEGQKWVDCKRNDCWAYQSRSEPDKWLVGHRYLKPDLIEFPSEQKAIEYMVGFIFERETNPKRGWRGRPED